MKVNGKLHRITNLQTFVQSFLTTGGKPTVGFEDFGRAKVYVSVDGPINNFGGGFLPNFSFKAYSGQDGSFSVDVPESLRPFRGRVIAYRPINSSISVPGIPPIEILSPLYRSEPFNLSNVTATKQRIFLHEITAGDADGISQAQISDEVSALASELKLDRVTATIQSSRIKARAERKGGVVTFEIIPRPSTSSNLEELIRLEVEEVDIDLPGPDFIVGLCVSKSEIEKKIRDGIKTFARSINGDILDKIEEEAPGVTALATITVSRIRYPVTGSRTIKLPGGQSFTVETRSIVLDPTAGVPRRLY